MQLNRQPITKKNNDRSAPLQVHSIFYTIQGEGPFAGTPACFVRLGGCNLRCPLCDTEYTEGVFEASPEDVVDLVQATKVHDKGLVVITGGEPFRQEATGLLAELLFDAGFYVQIETNGTMEPPDLNGMHYSLDAGHRLGVYIVCSPKTGKLNEYTAKLACAYKYVLHADHVDPVDGLPTAALNHTANPVLAKPKDPEIPVYLQPVDEQDEAANARHRAAVVESCMRYGYILQLQIHKLLELE